jgi:hypothetical protein
VIVFQHRRFQRCMIGQSPDLLGHLVPLLEVERGCGLRWGGGSLQRAKDAVTYVHLSRACSHSLRQDGPTIISRWP